MNKFMSAWERRGFLTYPRVNGKPRAGTREELSFSKGWERAQREHLLAQQSLLAEQMDFESDLGRNTYATEYTDGIIDVPEWD